MKSIFKLTSKKEEFYNTNYYILTNSEGVILNSLLIRRPNNTYSIGQTKVRRINLPKDVINNNGYYYYDNNLLTKKDPFDVGNSIVTQLLNYNIK